MKRLRESALNTGKEYDCIFKQRSIDGANSYDIDRWNKLLSRFRGGRFVDLGCLDSLAPILAKKKYPTSDIWGLDCARESMEFLAKTCPEINYLYGDVYENMFPDNYFDYAIAGELMEHLEFPERFVGETFRSLKIGGILAISVPKGETEAGEVDGERHIWSFEKVDVKNLLNPYGKVHITEMRSILFPFYEYRFPTIVAFCQKR